MGYGDTICFGTDYPLDKLKYTREEIFTGKYAQELFLKFKDSSTNWDSKEKFEEYYKDIFEFESLNILDTWESFWVLVKKRLGTKYIYYINSKFELFYSLDGAFVREYPYYHFMSKKEIESKYGVKFEDFYNTLSEIDKDQETEWRLSKCQFEWFLKFLKEHSKKAAVMKLLYHYGSWQITEIRDVYLDQLQVTNDSYDEFDRFEVTESITEGTSHFMQKTFLYNLVWDI